MWLLAQCWCSNDDFQCNKLEFHFPQHLGERPSVTKATKTNFETLSINSIMRPHLFLPDKFVKDEIEALSHPINDATGVVGQSIFLKTRKRSKLGTFFDSKNMLIAS